MIVQYVLQSLIPRIVIYPLDNITYPLYIWALDSTEFNLPWEIYSGNLWAHFQAALIQMF